MDSVWYPTWSTPLKIESGGRYPLGLNRFHNGLEDILIKSITVLADRLRQISYYCWAIGDLHRRKHIASYRDFVEAFRRRENALALGLSLCQPDYTIDGSTAVSRRVHPDTSHYDCSFALMQSNKLGAFGLYYAGTMYNLGLIAYDENGATILTKLGQELYELVESRFCQAKPEYHRKYCGHKMVPTSALIEWGKTNDLDNIRQTSCQDEQVFFRNLLFRLDQKKTSDFRRHSLALFLVCIQDCARNQTSFDELVLRNIHYYGCYYDHHREIKHPVIPRYLDDARFYWSIYEAQVYFRGWLTASFQCLLRYLKSREEGATIDEFLADVAWEQFNYTIAAFSGQVSDYAKDAMGHILSLITHSTQLGESLSEHYITQNTDFHATADVLAGFALVAANLLVRFQDIRRDKRYEYVHSSLHEHLWFDHLFYWAHMDSMPVMRFLRQVLQQFIINQHDLIMMGKNDLRRCWFTTERDKLFFQSDASLIWRPAKYETIMSFLQDMNLIEQHNDMWVLSAEGSKFLQMLEQGYH